MGIVVEGPAQKPWMSKDEDRAQRGLGFEDPEP